MTGYVCYYNAARQMGVVRGEDGRRYAVIESEIAEDPYGRQFLIDGEQVAFIPFDDEKGLLASRVTCSRIHNLQFDAEYRETCRIRDWKSDRGFGFAEREFNGNGLFVHVSEIITLGELHKGSLIRCLPVPSSSGKAYRATLIEIFKDEENSKEEVIEPTRSRSEYGI